MFNLFKNLKAWLYPVDVAPTPPVLEDVIKEKTEQAAKEIELRMFGDDSLTHKIFPNSDYKYPTDEQEVKPKPEKMKFAEGCNPDPMLVAAMEMALDQEPDEDGSIPSTMTHFEDGEIKDHE